MRSLLYPSMINWGIWSVKQNLALQVDANCLPPSICGNESSRPLQSCQSFKSERFIPESVIRRCNRATFPVPSSRPPLFSWGSYMKSLRGANRDATLVAGVTWARLARLTAVCGRQMRRSLAEITARHDLNDAEFLLLWACRELAENEVSQNGLAASIGLSSSQLSGLVEGLRQRGLADVKRSRLDRRRQHWCLTAAGDGVLDEILASLGMFESALNAELPAPEQADALSLLHRLATAAERVALQDCATITNSAVGECDALQGALS